MTLKKKEHIEAKRENYVNWKIFDFSLFEFVPLSDLSVDKVRVGETNSRLSRSTFCLSFLEIEIFTIKRAMLDELSFEILSLELKFFKVQLTLRKNLNC